MYELQPNSTLQCGKYRIKKVLGQGSFGITYLASMQESGEGCALEIDVAIKEFFMKENNTRTSADTSVTGSQSEMFRYYKEKFKTEAKNLAKLSNYDDIVKVYDVFEENNTVYFSMEYIEGTNLDSYIKQCGQLPENQAVEYIKSVAAALKHLHDNKMLHLDLKPKNIMRRSDGKVYLIDFGLSKQFDENGVVETSTTIGLGTPGYAPIEQANFKGYFAPTLDVYALGATFYKMLTGVTAPDSGDILNDGFSSLIQKMQSCGVSKDTIAVVEKAMKSRKSERCQNVGEFMKNFESSDTTPNNNKGSKSFDDGISKSEYKTKALASILIFSAFELGLLCFFCSDGEFFADEFGKYIVCSVVAIVIYGVWVNRLNTRRMHDLGVSNKEELNQMKKKLNIDKDPLWNLERFNQASDDTVSNKF